MEKLKEWWSKRWVKNAVFLAIIGIIFLTDAGQWLRIQILGATLRSPDIEQTTESATDAFSYPMEVMNAEGTVLTLSELQGKPILLNFWASWCVPCLAEFGSMADLQKEMPELQMVMVTAENQEDFEKYLAKTNYEFQFMRQLTRTPPFFEHRAIPSTYLIGRDGTLLYEHHGAANWASDDIVGEIRNLIGG